MNKESNFKIALVSIILIVGALVLYGCFFTVRSGHRAIVLRMGKISEVVGEGLHFKMPILDDIVRVDIRTLRSESAAAAGTKDLQQIETKVVVNYHFAPDELADTYSRVGLNVDTKIVDPRIQEVVKAVVARFSAEDLLKRRDDVRTEIVAGLTKSLLQYNLILEDVQITNFNFSESFNAAIESKQTAEQHALKATNDLQRIEIEAKQKIAMAQAEAETIKIQAEAIKAQGGAEYVQLKAIEKWNGQLPQVSGSNTPFINLGK